MDKKTKPIRILGICGSLDVESKTRLAIAVALEGAKKAGSVVSLIDLREYQLPLFQSPFLHPKSQEHIEKMKNEVRAADGLIIGTAEYHGSYSGALKNALDWMGFEELEGKMIGLVGVAGGELGATNALNHLRVVCRQLHAWVIPQQASISNSPDAFDGEGRPKNPELLQRLHHIGAEVVRFTKLHIS